MSKFLTRADWNLNIFHNYWTGRAGAAFVRDQRTNRFELGQNTDIFRSLVMIFVWSSSTRRSVGVSLAFICVEFGDTISFKSLDVGGVKSNHSTSWRNNSNFSQSMGMMRFINRISDLTIDYESTDWFMEKIENGSIMSGNVETDINSTIETYHGFKFRRLNS